MQTLRRSAVQLARLLACGLAVALFAGVSARAGELEGERWKVVSAERAGRPNPSELDAILSFDGGTLSILSPAGERVEFAYTLDSSHSPAHIDLTRGEADKRLTFHGIWKLEEERFTLCVAAPFNDRPTTFETAADQAISLTVHERGGEQSDE
jgi:uncharacterized protein (TIGR03067 family)